MNRSNRKAFLSVLLIICLSAVFYSAKRVYLHRQAVSLKPYEMAISQLEQSANKEWCDDQQKEQRRFVARVVDRFRKDIDELWKKRKPEEIKGEKLIRVGNIFLKVYEDKKSSVTFDRTVWNWSDAYGKLQQTQEVKEEKLWLDVDTAMQYLLKHDAERIIRQKKFLNPEKTMHTFRRHDAVSRISAREYQVELDPGHFFAQKKLVKQMIEREWKADGIRLTVKWSVGKEGIYRFVVHSDSAKSATNHKLKTIFIASFSPEKTIAHEVGHVLGFDDHYYDVWHDKYCYYTQEYRVSDLMSDSASGKVNREHWQILDRAYPWKSTNGGGSFGYTYTEE